MNLEDIRIEIKHYIEEEEVDEVNDDDEGDGEIITVCTAYMVKKEKIKKKHKVIAELSMPINETGETENICICIEDSYKNKELFFNNIDYNFCENIDILNKGIKIGGACLNRIFVENMESVAVWLDNEAPNSMEIGTHIYKKDLQVCEGRFIGVIDELILDNKYIEKEISEYIIYMVYSIVNYLDFNIYYLYTQPKSMNHEEYLNGTISFENLKTYQEIGFEIVNKKRYILCKNLWNENKHRDNLNKVVKDVYFP